MDKVLHNGITPIQQMAASGAGAILTSLFMTPLDVVKIRLQVQQKPLVKGQCFLYCNGLMDHLCTCINGNSQTKPWYRLPGHFNGTADAFMKIARNEGLASLWSGLQPTLLMAIPATMIYFTSYDQLKMFLGYGHKNPAEVWWIPMTAGTIARVGAVTVISPLELIRTKMQSRSLTYMELKNCIRTSITHDGWLSLWRGLSPTLLRDVPFSALYWANYEIFKAALCARTNLREPTFAISFTSGATAGMIAGVLTLPFDVVKTHRQMELGELETMQSGKRLSSTFEIMTKIHSERGIGGLFAGITPRIMKVAPACAIMISIYEVGKSFFRNRNNLNMLENG